MTKQRRWLKSAIAAAAEPQVVLPWQRTARRKPQSLTAAPTQKKQPAMAAR